MIAVKPANKAELPTAERSALAPDAAEQVKPRVGPRGMRASKGMRRTQSRESVSQALERIRKAARERKKEKLAALFHDRPRPRFNGKGESSNPFDLIEAGD